VLAIAAAKLGARRVLALDLDPVAVESAKENVQLNGVDGTVAVMQSDLLGVLRSAGLVTGGSDSSSGAAITDVGSLGVKLPVKLVVANILAEIILLFIQDVYEVLQSGGTYITSGIYKNKADDVEKGLLQAGFLIERKERDQDWIAFVAKKP
jgi:ribosomal protein L11 methyltransferase